VTRQESHDHANVFAVDIIGNGLLAIGSMPAMIHAREEATEAVNNLALSGGVLYCNIGTLSDMWIDSLKVKYAISTFLISKNQLILFELAHFILFYFF
jgi:hydroxyethylthiazole kinase-like sugar kinase family protein